MAWILTIFGPNRSQRRNLFFEKFSNERRRHRGIVVVVIVAVVVAVVVVIGGFGVACITGTSLIMGHWLNNGTPTRNLLTNVELGKMTRLPLAPPVTVLKYQQLVLRDRSILELL